MSLIQIPVSYGELIDKITILKIKSRHVSDADKLTHVRHELSFAGNHLEPDCLC